MGFYRYSIQMITDLLAGENIIAAGGKVLVCASGTPDKVTIYDARTEVAIANPMTPTRGMIAFKTSDTVSSVDLYVQAPGGQFTRMLTVKPSGPNEIVIPTKSLLQHYVIPFSAADSTAAVETDTGFDLPSNAVLLPSVALRVTALDATETIDVGTATADTGDPDLLIAAASLAALGMVATTLAALNIASGGKTLVYTLSAGSDTAKGFVTVPVLLAA